MILKTERLDLIPLKACQLKLWIENCAALERELGCSYQAEPVSGFFGEIVKSQLQVVEQCPENYLWNSFWFLIRKSDRVVVGAADFKGLPNRAGEVEIGYGLGAAFEHQGYMTEAVKALCNWVSRQKNVANIIAETETDGLASQKILRRCGFKKFKTAQTTWWKR